MVFDHGAGLGQGTMDGDRRARAMRATGVRRNISNWYYTRITNIDICVCVGTDNLNIKEIGR